MNAVSPSTLNIYQWHYYKSPEFRTKDCIVPTFVHRLAKMNAVSPFTLDIYQWHY